MGRSRKQQDLPYVSIIIPTIYRKDKLKNCLTSLKKLDYPKSLLEIIVVDNGCSDGTSEMITKEFNDVKLFKEPRRGVSFARNTGVLNSKGEIIAFLDDDCQVNKDWLKKICPNFLHKDVIGVGGPVILRLDQVQMHPKLLEGFLEFSQFLISDSRRYVIHLSGANMAFKRKAFKLTFFDPKLGPPKAFLEDFDFCATLHNLGFKLIYEPSAIVYHFPDSSKFDIRYLLANRSPKEGFSLYYYHRKRKPWIATFKYCVRSFFRNTLRFLRYRDSRYIFQMTLSLYSVLACLQMFKLQTTILNKKQK